jgi:Cytochrome oxidase assembly protein.
MEELGGFFGDLIILFYALAVLNFCFKYLNRNFRDKLKKNEDFYKVFMKILKIFVKYHRYFGGATIIMILVHFYLQFIRFGISVTGCFAAGIMILQILLGIYGQVKKPKGKVWIMLHRGIAVLLLITILIHII